MEEDYYALLNVPRNVGMPGLQTAYARLSADLATRMSVDPTARDQLIRLNRAFGVLGNSDLRKAYDAKHFSDEIAEEERAMEAEVAKSQTASNFLFGALLLIVGVQVAVVSYIGRGEFGGFFESLMDLVTPGGAS
jgi:DnaJ-class molecular chaperone